MSSADPTGIRYDEYLTPESADGVITRVLAARSGAIEVEVEFPIESAFHALVRDDLEHVIFASRSRLARLGIEVRPTTPLTLGPRHMRMQAELHTTVSEYGIANHLPQLVIPGLKLGRLVHCSPDDALTSEQVMAALSERLIQLPQGFSLGSDGSLTIRPHPITYGLARQLTTDDLMSIVLRTDGRALLSMLQVPRSTPTLQVPPGDGIITSCSMFLHRHYMIIENPQNSSARHLQAVALDPVHTRGTRIFLEFFNPTDHPVLNPWATARLYRAHPTPQRRWPIVQVMSGPPAAGGTQPERRPYHVIRDTFDRLEQGSDRVSAYFRRAVAVADRMDIDPTLATLQSIELPSSLPTDHIYNYAARGQESQTVLQADRFATSEIVDLTPDARKAVFLSYFPNFVEHMHLCQAGLQRKISQIVFRRASFEHGMFLSARDHGRLADYAALGIDVYWADDDNAELLRHVFPRGHRGFFVSAQNEPRLRQSMLFAFYGSARPLPPSEATKLEDLIGRLHEMFGPNMGILTGGGPGAMQQATEAANRIGLLTGASYIETADQGTIKNVDFFQTFQDRSRHYRQRWFDVCSFQVFCIGGVGTLEEIGQTFTDVKLGIIERGPLVFFGSTDGNHFWSSQVDMLKRMAREQRAPEWIHSHVLLSDQANEVVRFYRSILELA